MSMDMIALFFILFGFLAIFVFLAIDQYKNSCQYRKTQRAVEQASHSVDYVCNEIRDKCLVEISADLFFVCLEELNGGDQE